MTTTGGLGLDGCPGGWVGVHVEGGRVAGACVVQSVGEAHARFAPAAVGIDIPIGLADEPRPADAAARRLLGRAAASVFNAPARCVVDAYASRRVMDYAEASALARRLTGRGMSRQSWGLVPKVAEVDAYLAGAPTPVIEVHPEVQFRLLADGPLPRKTSWAGVEGRRALLAARGLALPTELPGGDRVAPHDILDAAAVAWAAAGLAAGEPLVAFPDDPPVDGTGRRVAIWARAAPGSPVRSRA